MTTQDLISMFNKGNYDKFNVSGKQLQWLIDVARKECVYQDHGFAHFINLGLDVYKIKACTVNCSGGSYVGKKQTGSYSIRLCHYIRYKDTGNTEFRESYELNGIRDRGYLFDIIPASEN